MIIKLFNDVESDTKPKLVTVLGNGIIDYNENIVEYSKINPIDNLNHVYYKYNSYRLPLKATYNDISAGLIHLKYSLDNEAALVRKMGYYLLKLNTNEELTAEDKSNYLSFNEYNIYAEDIKSKAKIIRQAIDDAIL